MFLPVSITVFALIAVALLFVVLSRPIDITVEDDYFKIGGMYGNTYDYAQVENLQYLTEIPEILTRTNGAAFGSHLRGYFKMEEYGSVTLFLNTKHSEYIYFEYDGKKIIFNDESEALKKVYDEIYAELTD